MECTCLPITFIINKCVLLCSDCSSMSVGGVTFPLEQQSKDPQSVVYTGQYDTEGVAHTKSGERQPVQINIQVWVQRTHLMSTDPLYGLIRCIATINESTDPIFCSVFN